MRQIAKPSGLQVNTGTSGQGHMRGVLPYDGRRPEGKWASEGITLRLRQGNAFYALYQCREITGPWIFQSVLVGRLWKGK